MPKVFQRDFELSTGLSLWDSIDSPKNGVIELKETFMSLKRNNDRSAKLASKPPKKDDCPHVHIYLDGKQVSTMGLLLRLLLWLISSGVIHITDPQYPQLPVLPESIEQIQ
jgi:hypothetical protein